jgi:hypothetical protein
MVEFATILLYSSDCTSRTKLCNSFSPLVRQKLLVNHDESPNTKACCKSKSAHSIMGDGKVAQNKPTISVNLETKVLIDIEFLYAYTCMKDAFLLLPSLYHFTRNFTRNIIDTFP